MVINYLDSKRISALSSDFATTTSYNHIADTGDDFLNLHDTNRYAVMKILSGSPAIGTSVQKIKISMRKVGTPAGTFKVGIWNASDVLVISVTNTASSFLTTSYVDYEFDMGSATELLLDYKVGIEYLTGVGVSNRIDVETIYATTETGYSKGYPALNTGGVDLDILMSFDSTPVTISKPTNVQDNSILVEKDTANRYWFDAEEIPSSTQLYEGSNSDSDISTTGGSTNFNINSTVSNALYFNPQRSSSIFGQTWDLGSNLSETAWVLRAKMNITSLDNSGDTVRLFIGMNNQDSSVGAGNSSNKFIGAGSFINSGGQQWYRVSVKGNTLDVAEANQHTIATGILYIEIIRKTETTYSVRWTTSSDFTGGTLVDNQTVGSHGGSGSTSSMALRYFWMSNINVNGNQDAHIQGHLEDVKIYDGVTSVPATWTLET